MLSNMMFVGKIVPTKSRQIHEINLSVESCPLCLLFAGRDEVGKAADIVIVHKSNEEALQIPI